MDLDQHEGLFQGLFPKVLQQAQIPQKSWSNGRQDAQNPDRILQRTQSTVDWDTVATLPRCVRPNQRVFVTSRAVGRSYRFVPRRVIRESMLYVLAAIAEKYRERIALHDVLFMSNHMHLVATDLTGCLPAFMQDLNSLLSRQLNALRGTTGTNIEAGYNLVAVQDDESLLRHIVYTLANPCSAHIVARARHWKGVNTLGLEYGVPLEVARPNRGLWSSKCTHRVRPQSIESKRARFAGRTCMTPRAKLVLVRPDVCSELDDKQLRQFIREQLRERENELIRTRSRPVSGMKSALSKDFWTIPVQEEPFGMTPSFSASSKKQRIKAARERRSFIDQYRDALNTFVTGSRKAVFPVGTWLMVQRYCAVVDTG